MIIEGEKLPEDFNEISKIAFDSLEKGDKLFNEGNYIEALNEYKDEIMSNDIYLEFKQEINDIKKRFRNKKIKPIQFIESIVLKYQMELENTNIDDITKRKIKEDFIEYVRNILYEMENEIDRNRCIRDNSARNTIYYWIDKLFNKSANNIEYNIYNDSANIMNSVDGINNLKSLIDELLSYIKKSEILTDDEIKKYIKPTIDRINEKY